MVDALISNAEGEVTGGMSGVDEVEATGFSVVEEGWTLFFVALAVAFFKDIMQYQLLLLYDTVTVFLAQIYLLCFKPPSITSSTSIHLSMNIFFNH